jgi:hypothetical protein
MLSALKQRFRSAVLRSAARKYARRLGPRLRRDYGASEHYTPGQIKAAITSCQLPPRYISFGYAAFMSEDAFQKLGIEGDYHSLRLLFHKHVPPAAIPTSRFAPESSFGADPGGDGDYGSF